MSPKPTSDAEKNIPIRTYGRRRSKGLKSTRANAMEEVLPQFSLPPLPPGECRGEGTIDPQTFFNQPVKEVWFEIGFGNGEHLLQQALAHPDTGFIGCEPFMNGVAALCVGIKEKNVKNIRLWPDDARMLMEKIKPGSLARIFLLHPDPWPKTRHHKRRFVQTETLDEMARLLKSGGELRMATDHAELAAWLLEKTGAHPAFKRVEIRAEDWLETRYGQKGLKQGRPPVFFSFKKV